jgi:site-specific recombinase XerD
LVALRRGHGRPLGYATFEAQLRELGRRAGVRVTAHMFRHALAQALVDTAGLKVAQEVLGHANVSTTARSYARVDEAAMVTALAAAREILDAGPAIGRADGRGRWRWRVRVRVRRRHAGRARAGREGGAVTAEGLGDAPFDRDALERTLEALQATLSLRGEKARAMRRACRSVTALLDATAGETLQRRWTTVEREPWTAWEAGRDRLAPVKRWTWGPAALVLSRSVRPGWELLSRARLSQWLGWLPAAHPLNVELRWLRQRIGRIEWAGGEVRRRGHLLGVRIMLHRGYDTARQITDADLRAVPERVSRGMDALDAVLCAEGVLARTAQRGSQRRLGSRRPTPGELVSGSRVPERFREVHRLYLEAYQQRISDVYATTRHKHNSLEKLWSYLDAEHPEIASAAQVRRAHLLAFVPWAIERAREVQRTGPRLPVGEDRATADRWLINVRCFFADIGTWALEDGSPFAALAPPAVPLERHDLVGVGFENARRRQQKRQVAAILDLEREVPKIRALATRRWQDAQAALAAAPADRAARRAEVDAFWDWALLELLLQSGLRIEEACELTTLDILRRRHADGRTYYLLHVKPSKFDRARVIPIGDGLGRVIGQIIRHVKAFYGTSEVPDCDGWDSREKRAGPHAPYLLQGAGHPSQIAYGKIRSRFARLSRTAGPTQRRQRAGAAPARLPVRVRLRAPQQQHADPRHPGAARPRLAGHGDGLRQALPDHARGPVPQDRPRHLPGLSRRRQPARARRRGMAALLRDAGAARHGHPPLRASGR